MLWVGLTGGIASGKSTATQIIRQLGYSVIDADQLAREVVAVGSPGLQSLVKKFGSGILRPDQSLDRKAFAKMVFNDLSALKATEAIIHPLVKMQVLLNRKRLETEGKKICFYDVPLLFEKRMQSEFDHTILIASDLAVQKLRLKERNGFTDQEIEARLKNQMPLIEKEMLADFVITNNGSMEDLKQKILNLCQQLLSTKN